MGWRIATSIVTFFGLLGFLLLYFALWSGPYSPGQSAVIVVVAVLAFLGANGAAWASWGIRQVAPGASGSGRQG